MQGPFGRMFMNCVGRAYRVLKPDNDDADFLLDPGSLLLLAGLFPLPT
jgi:hypothetical protein